MANRRRMVPGILALAVLAPVGTAHGLEMRPHLEGAASHFVALGGGWQAREIGPGMIGTGALELALSRRFGVEGRLLAGRFTQGGPGADPSLKQVDQTGLFGVTAGLRVRPIWEDRGLWIGAAAGSTQTGGVSRTLFDARIGWDFVFGDALRGGPFVGYFHVVQPESALRPEDGRAAMLGLHVAFDGYEPRPATPGDTQLAARPKVAPTSAPAKKAPAKKAATNTPAPAPVVSPTPEPPMEWPPLAVEAASVAGDEIVLSDRLYFEVNSAVIASESRPLLESVAKVLIAHPEIERLQIQGHTDDAGSDEWNQKLSTSRAAAVRDVLIACGVPAARLTTKGFGKTRPLSPGADESSRRRNRRVEFVIERRTAQ